MTSEGFGEMFEGDSAVTGAGKFPLVSMGAEQRVTRAQTRERGPPSELAEILFFLSFFASSFIAILYKQVKIGNLWLF
jgi:hypothetical protein